MNLHSIPLRLLAPVANKRLIQVAERCLHRHPAQRYSSASEVGDALAQVNASPHARGSTHSTRRLSHGAIWRTALALANRLARAEEDGRSRDGRSANLGGPPTVRDLGSGLAGRVLALHHAHSAFGQGRHRDALRRASTALVPPSNLMSIEPLPGLYVGAAGISLSIMAAAVSLGCSDMYNQALTLGAKVAGLPHLSPDMFHGSAGRIRAHLYLWRQSGDQTHLDAAKKAARHILETVVLDQTGPRWVIPPGYGGSSGSAFFGYAHGSAGIADALLELYEVTQEAHLIECALEVYASLRRVAVVGGASDTEAYWPVSPGTRLSQPFWCHGAGGIGRFLLRASLYERFVGASEMALKAARAVLAGSRWSNVSYCHGLAGNIDFLLDAARLLDARWLSTAADELAEIMLCWLNNIDGQIVGRNELEPSGPGWLAGWSGTLSCLVRLANPNFHPVELGGLALGSPDATKLI
ncbi:MAG: hypothetical protein M3082_08325 [Candidatus Dormibacteraeota bacterium]|nr:hypothetical protein [Candidatus Dormibacteraeota bacterium]